MIGAGRSDRQGRSSGGFVSFKGDDDGTGRSPF